MKELKVVEIDMIITSINCLIDNFYNRYNERPRYVKMPLWIKNELIEYSKAILTNFNYKEFDEKEEFKILDLKICETITINRLDEIEVF